MNITSKLVKTTYSIQLTRKDRMELFSNYWTKESTKLIYADAFGKLTEDSTVRDIDDFFDNIQFIKNRAKLNDYIADYYGFDGWSCSAFLHHGVIKMECYKYGNRMEEK